MGLQNRSYSKIEEQHIKFLFTPLLDKIKADNTLDPEVTMKQMDMYNRGFLRNIYGIRQLMFNKKENILTITIGLEDRKGLFILETNLGE